MVQTFRDALGLIATFDRDVAGIAALSLRVSLAAVGLGSAIPVDKPGVVAQQSAAKAQLVK